ncbi:MAG: glutamyl-tRNA reductase [Pseudomonadota bacterium]|nr:glutamyl-tRNA reductase [Pseudomonadota bacterium]
MSLVIVGFNHIKTSIEFREQLACSNDEQVNIVSNLVNMSLVQGGFILATCNRLEIICTCDDPRRVLQEFSLYKNIDFNLMTKYAYIYQGLDAFTHLLRVASGLDSMVLGETQVFGQLRQGFNLAANYSLLGDYLTKVMSKIFFLAKQVRNDSDLENNSLGYANVILNLAKSVFNLKNKKILLIGAGDTISKIITYFIGVNFAEIIIANRTYENAEKLAKKFSLRPIHFSDITSQVQEVDIIISAISSPLPIIGKGMIERRFKDNSNVNKTLLLVDLGVPRNIEPEVKDIEDVYLYNIDNLHDIIEKSLNNRKQAAKDAELIVAHEAKQCFKQFEDMASLEILKNFRCNVENIRDEVLESSKNALKHGKDANYVLELALRQLTNKILHKPTLSIRKAIVAERGDILKLTKDFLELPGK